MVAFTEPVNGFTDACALDISLAGSVTYGGVSIADGPQEYTVTLDSVTGEGAVTLAMAGASVISDLAGNTLAQSCSPVGCEVLMGRPEVWVDGAYDGSKQGSESQPYSTLGEGVTAALEDSRVYVRGDTGHPSYAETLRIDKPLRLEANGGPIRIGDLTLPAGGAMTSGSEETDSGVIVIMAGDETDDNGICSENGDDNEDSTGVLSDTPDIPLPPAANNPLLITGAQQVPAAGGVALALLVMILAGLLSAIVWKGGVSGRS
jgi:hypothetical protein